MRIAQLVSNYHTVRPEATQAIYSHTALLSNGLQGLGNNVTVYGAGDSQTNAKLESVYPQALKLADLSEETRKQYVHLLLSECYKNSSNFDIIHSHFTLLSSYYSQINNRIPTIQSIHSPIERDQKPLLKKFKDNYYVSFSLAHRKQMPELNWVANIYHGVDLGMFNFNPLPKDYLLYLGRITEDKGVHLAIEAAKASGLQLVIAGLSYPTEGYWHDKIEKHIDGKTVRYVGEADLKTKIEYLQNAKALMFPTQYDEAFGLVMIEAMSCGTPVIGWNSGSVPEVIQDRQTGYLVESVEDMTKAIKAIDKIKREECRARAKSLFSIEKMVSGYEKVYLRVIEEHREKMKNR